MFNEIAYFHSAPTVWWTGQFAVYVMRPNTKFRAYLDEKKGDAWGPIVGCAHWSIIF